MTIELVKRISALQRQVERSASYETTPITNKTPASAGDTGVKGEIAWDSSYIYVCTATDTWKRVAIATW